MRTQWLHGHTATTGCNATVSKCGWWARWARHLVQRGQRQRHVPFTWSEAIPKACMRTFRAWHGSPELGGRRTRCWTRLLRSAQVRCGNGGKLRFRFSWTHTAAQLCNTPIEFGQPCRECDELNVDQHHEFTRGHAGFRAAGEGEGHVSLSSCQLINATAGLTQVVEDSRSAPCLARGKQVWSSVWADRVSTVAGS